MTDEQNERAARVWREAYAAYGNAAAEVDALDNRGQVLAGDQAATAVIAADRARLVAEVERLRDALERDAVRFEHCAVMISKSFEASGTLRAERTIKAKHYALEARAALKDTRHEHG